jgi:hypothetical protein
VRQLVARDDVIAVLVELVQLGGGDLLEEQCRRMHEEVIGGARHPRGDVGEQDFIPALERRQAEGSRKVDAGFPLLRRHVGLLHLRRGCRCGHDFLLSIVA